jgi:hypothetical protein
MQYRVNFLVDGLYSITIWGKKCRILNSVTYNVYTPKHTRMCQNKQDKEFQILITYLNTNDPTSHK